MIKADVSLGAVPVEAWSICQLVDNSRVETGVHKRDLFLKYLLSRLSPTHFPLVHAEKQRMLVQEPLLLFLLFLREEQW